MSNCLLKLANADIQYVANYQHPNLTQFTCSPLHYNQKMVSPEGINISTVLDEKLVHVHFHHQRERETSYSVLQVVENFDCIARVADIVHK